MTNAPVVDLDALERLRDELGDRHILRMFLARYTSMLEQRVNRLQNALLIQDHETWMDAVLSLKTSSALVGAVALSALAEELERRYAKIPQAAAEWPLKEAVPVVIEAVRAVAHQTAAIIGDYLRQLDPCHPKAAPTSRIA